MTEGSYDIRIDIETTYVESESLPEEDRYVFAYTITIRNEGRVPAKLLSRHWVIRDATGRIEERDQPVIISNLDRRNSHGRI